ncbi:hypothetical protein TSUD_151970 [Trifolium subterraneum]|uniref:Uncharacterized protein n=1 Tax=Trifolium subterraneum TaxID=3900 RepID=A0A2Z6MTD9_TRISU|nr:hypothetical protein TSUD_151970 [Trifolium subterraneum]
MEAVVVDVGSKLLKAGFAIPDQTPGMIIPTQMKQMLDDGSITYGSPVDDVTIDPVANKEYLVQLMFENFKISGFYASEQSVLSLYAVGRISGCTVDIGHGKIDIVLVIEGAVHHLGSRRFEFGGTNLTNFLSQEHGKSNPQVNISMSDVEKIKEQYSCSVEDELAYQKTQYSCPVEKHTLPDGQVCFPNSMIVLTCDTD